MAQTGRKRDVKSETNHATPGGGVAKSSSQAPFFHDIPPVLWHRIARRYTVGHLKYSPEIVANINWRTGLTDPWYIADRLNHMVCHMVNFIESGDMFDDNLGAIVWNAAFLMEVQRVAPDVLDDVIGHCNHSGPDAVKFRDKLRSKKDGVHSTRGVPSRTNRGK